jgi:hypothetical protein
MIALLAFGDLAYRLLLRRQVRRALGMPRVARHSPGERPWHA